MIVMKFGGTSVGDAERLLNLVGIVSAQPLPRVVVVSAASGVTNLLLEAATLAAAGKTAESADLEKRIHARHQQLLSVISSAPERVTATEVVKLLHDQLNNSLLELRTTGEASKQDSDRIVATGEKVMSTIVAAVLRATGVDAEHLFADTVIGTDDRFGNARPDKHRTQQQTTALVLPLLTAGKTVVITGFIGGTSGGATTTLGRGGSDYSATLLGAALAADEVQIWTDVPGVLTADPRQVSEASVVSQISFDEAQELAHFGAKVLHPRTIRPAVALEIPVRILSTFAPEEPGTLVTRNWTGNQLKAVTMMKNLLLITIDVPELEDLSGAASQVFGAFYSDGIEVVLAAQASSRRRMTYLVDAGQDGDCERVSRRLDEVLEDFEADIGCTEGVALVAAVGHGAAGQPKALARLLDVLERADIPVLASSQQMSNVALVAAIPGQFADLAVQMIHDAFIGPQVASAGGRRRRRSDMLSESMRVG